MTPSDLRSQLKALGMTQRSFAATTGMSVSTVNRWAKGVAPVPRWVEVLLDCRERLAEAELMLLYRRRLDEAASAERLAASCTPPADRPGSRPRAAATRG